MTPQEARFRTAQAATRRLPGFRKRIEESLALDKLRAQPFSRVQHAQATPHKMGANTTNQSGTTVFFDDFNGSSLSAQWTPMSRCGDVSNSEIQCYLPGNISVANSLLSVTAKSQSQSCSDHNIDGSVRNGPFSRSFTSGMVQMTTFNFLYGTIEFKAKMPNFTGMWPGSLWMLGCNCQQSNMLSADNIGLCNWDFDTSRSSEVDIAEFIDTVVGGHQAVFSQGTGSSDFSTTGGMSDASNGFHVYKLVWSVGQMSWFQDGVLQVTWTDARVPATPMFALINMALRSNTTGSGLPASMDFDYVKVTQP